MISRFLPLHWQRAAAGILIGTVTAVSLAACGSGQQPPANTGPVVLPDGTIATPTPPPAAPVPNAVPESMEAVWEAYSILLREYVDQDQIDPEELAAAAIAGMIDSLGDRYSAYIAPQHFRIEQQSFQGAFEGIGAEVTLSENGQNVMIVAPIDGSPAKAAGIRAGDRILAVDGEDATGWSVIQAVNKIRGQRGTPVTLTVEHVGEVEAVDITIIRDRIEQNSVDIRMLDDAPYGVLKLKSFTAESARETRDGIRQLIDMGAEGIVLDVRNNPGGLLSATVDVASHFLTGGLVTYEVDGRGNRDNWPVKPGGEFPDIPIVLLVNGFSASGSEVLAGALQDHGRAVVIGTQTFGKGSVNLMRELSNGGGVYLTIARWYTPDGRLLEGEGVTPDVTVSLPPNPTEDVQMTAAITQLDFQTSPVVLR